MRKLKHFTLKKQIYLRKKKFSADEKAELQKRKFCYIYAFRHGLTNYNDRDIFTGCLDSVLGKQGFRDAEKIARQIKNRKFEVAYVSHLRRSKQTLKPSLKYHPELREIIEDDRIIERCYGDLEGHSKNKFARENPVLFPKIHRGYSTAPPHGESFAMVEKRVMSFMKDLIKKMKKEKVNVAISCHGNSLRPIRKYFEGLSRTEMSTLENPWDKAFVYKVKVR